MTEQTHIFDTPESTELIIRQKTYKRRIKTAQITALIISLILAGYTATMITTGALGAFIISLVFLAISICSFKWVFPFLLTYTILYNISILLFMLSTLMLLNRSEVNGAATTFMVIADIVYIILDIMIIVGTIAAKKYSNLSKPQRHE